MEDFSLPHIMAIFRRWNQWFFIVFAVLFQLAIIFALNWSNYRSKATVEIEQPEVPQHVILPTIGNNTEEAVAVLADAQIGQMEKKVTSLDSLSQIIAKFNLYPEYRKTTPPEVLADKMRGKIKVDLISSPISNPVAAQKGTAEQLSAIAFTVSFDYSNSLVAQQVTAELVRRFIDEDTQRRQAQARATSQFLTAQIKSLEVSMAEQEKKIADFKEKYGETGPTALLFNQQASVTTALDLRNIESQITANEGTQGSLRSQLATVDPYSRVVADGQVLTTPAIQLKALEAQYSTLSAHYGPDYPDIVKIRGQIQALRNEIGSQDNAAQLKAQVRDMRTNLAAARSTKGPDNPDVKQLARQLQGLEIRLAATEEGSGSGIKKDADNPAYLALTAQLRAEEEQHKSLVEQRNALMAQQARYQHAIADNPNIEKQMAVLSRDYENAQLRYRELKEKKMAADMSGELEQEKKGRQFTIIDPPSLPHGTYPAQILIVLAGLILALAGGITTVAICEAMNQSVYGQHHLASIVGMPPLATVPYIHIKEEEDSVLTVLRAYTQRTINTLFRRYGIERG